MTVRRQKIADALRHAIQDEDKPRAFALVKALAKRDVPAVKTTFVGGAGSGAVAAVMVALVPALADATPEVQAVLVSFIVMFGSGVAGPLYRRFVNWLEPGE